jgi:hypothetical protein
MAESVDQYWVSTPLRVARECFGMLFDSDILLYNTFEVWWKRDGDQAEKRSLNSKSDRKQLPLPLP